MNLLGQANYFFLKGFLASLVMGSIVDSVRGILIGRFWLV
jgi:hypothetical protein